jgi:GDP-L-fucose synthase
MSPVYTLVHSALEAPHVPLGVPNASRDWTYAGDIALAFAFLLEHLPVPYACYNISSGRTRSLHDVAQIISQLAPGFAWRAERESSTLNGESLSVRGPLNTDRLRELGFSACVSLEEGLRLTVEWFRQELSASPPRTQPVRDPDK